MTLTEQQQKGQEILNTIIRKSWEDTNFKKDLIRNPIATIETVTGKKIELPDGKSIVVQDQTDKNTVYINIPGKPNISDIELNETQLEAIAGGNGIGDLLDDIIETLVDSYIK